MDITIIGTGNMARGIATRALAGGHAVTLLGTESGKAEALAGELAGDVGGRRGRRRARWRRRRPRDPLRAIDTCSSRYGDQLGREDGRRHHQPRRPRVVRAARRSRPARPPRRSPRRPPGANVVKAWNTTFAGTLVEGEVAGQPIDVLVASDDDDAKAAVRQIVEDGGPRAGRRRPARPRPRARGPRLPAHGAPAAARHRLREHRQGPRVSRRGPGGSARREPADEPSRRRGEPVDRGVVRAPSARGRRRGGPRA